MLQMDEQGSVVEQVRELYAWSITPLLSQHNAYTMFTQWGSALPSMGKWQWLFEFQLSLYDKKDMDIYMNKGMLILTKVLTMLCLEWVDSFGDSFLL